MEWKNIDKIVTLPQQNDCIFFPLVLDQAVVIQSSSHDLLRSSVDHVQVDNSANSTRRLAELKFKKHTHTISF